MQQSPSVFISLLDWATQPRFEWAPDEFGAILRHQLSAPLMIVGDDRPSAAEGFDTIGDLFQTARPPVQLLQLVKSFAKASRQQSNGAIPDEIATVIYYLAIGLARTRCGEYISTLSDAELADGLAWVSALAWVDEEVRAIAGRIAREVDGD